DTPNAIYRKDYTVPAYQVDTVEIGFDLDPALTRVATRLTMKRNPASTGSGIVLVGDEVELVALRMNGKTLGKRDYQLKDGILTIPGAPDEATLEIETALRPQDNTYLMGLYVSNG